MKNHNESCEINPPESVKNKTKLKKTRCSIVRHGGNLFEKVDSAPVADSALWICKSHC